MARDRLEDGGGLSAAPEAERGTGEAAAPPTAGSLVLIGGGCDPRGEAFGAFVERAHARDGGCIVGITSASQDPAGSAREWLGAFRRAGADRVDFPVIDGRDRASDPRVAELLMQADGIFLGGGDQVQLVATLAGSPAEDALRAAWLRGAVIGGTSAGAAALTETILAGAEPDAYGQMQELYLGPGFGYLGFHTLIDTHFTERRRLQRLFMVIARNPALLGLGIDEDTAMVVDGRRAEVVGRGSVTFVDGRSVRFDNAREVMGSRALTLSHLRVGIVGSGYVLDLHERELEILMAAHERDHPMEVLRSEDGSS